MKPRLIETEAELDLLPEGSVIRTKEGGVTYVHYGMSTNSRTGEEYAHWGAPDGGFPWGDYAPAWVLWEGQVEE